jgi:hypothetical protein
MASAASLAVAGCSSMSTRELASYEPGSAAQCYDRESEPYTMVVDAHFHPKPFGGPAVPIDEVQGYLDKTGVRFVVYFGIGQVLEINETCTYYLDCPGTAAIPSIKNDFANALEYDNFRDTHEELPAHTILSMSFMDLANPEDIVDIIGLYDREYPGMFGWAGELNVVKQALLGNSHDPATMESIDGWKGFMDILRERNIPVTLHSDLGNNDNPTEFVPLMEHVLDSYPDNKIVWAHMGLSKELTDMDPSQHIDIMSKALDRAPNLMLDISWRVLYDTYFVNPEFADQYVDFFNKYSDRILTGTDFVASRAKTFGVYKEELDVVSRIHQGLTDDAFRNIALGQGFFDFAGLDYGAPQICSR